MNQAASSTAVTPRTIKSLKLEDFGIFKNSYEQGAPPDFLRYNLVYGWNRSGKTTFSRGFTSCERRVLFPDYSSGKLKITLSDGAEITHLNLSGCDLPIKVFNADFIKENIAFDGDDKHMEPIVYIGEEDIESKKKLDAALAKKDGLQKAYEDAERIKKEKENAEDKFRISAAQAITPILTNKTVHDRYYSYDKAKVKDRIETVGIGNFTSKKLADKNFQELKKLIGSEAKPAQQTLSNYTFTINIDGDAYSDLAGLTTGLNGLLSKQAVSETIERLKNDAQISAWVKSGYDLHESKQEKAKCLFCQNDIQGNFWDLLAKHFSKDFEELATKVRNADSELKRIKPSRVPLENKDLYPEQQQSYVTAAKNLNDASDQIEAWVKIASEKVAEKQKDLFVLGATIATSDDLLKTYNDAVATVNAVFTEHNKQTARHDDAVKQAKEKLEDHLLAEALSTNDYGQMKKDVEDSSAACKTAHEAKNNNIIERH